MRYKSFYLCTIAAPNPEARKEAARHLRYWPYVKSYSYQGKNSLLVCVNLGEAKNSKERKQLFERSRELIRLCLRQYGVWVTPWMAIPPFLRWALPHGFPGKPIDYGETFLRPTSEVRPFLDFIRELDQTPHSVLDTPHSGLRAGTSISFRVI